MIGTIAEYKAKKRKSKHQRIIGNGELDPSLLEKSIICDAVTEGIEHVKINTEPMKCPKCKLETLNHFRGFELGEVYFDYKKCGVCDYIKHTSSIQIARLNRPKVKILISQAQGFYCPDCKKKTVRLYFLTKQNTKVFYCSHCKIEEPITDEEIEILTHNRKVIGRKLRRKKQIENSELV